MKTTLVIFGITGDLSRRKLLPALKEIITTTGEDLSIVGVSRRDVDVPELLAQAGVEELTDLTSVFTMDLAEAGDYVRLKAHLTQAESDQLVFYLSVPPTASADIVDYLGQAGLNGPQVKILFEKPFGFDYESAREFIDRTGRYFTEDQLYRIDHYMAKEVAAELMRLRADAQNHHHAWSRESVASVTITASETLGVEDRAVFYEQTGALRDIIQGHLMQLLALVLMDLSGDFSMDDVAVRRTAALQALDPAKPHKAIRAQYAGYDEEVGNPGSQTETFVHLTLESTDPRWQGVPLILATGKQLDQKRTQIVITYTDGSEDVFEEGKVVSSDVRLPDAYERVLISAFHGRKHIFTTSPEILRSWQVLAPLQQAWEMNQRPLGSYPPGATIEEVVKSHI